VVRPITKLREMSLTPDVVALVHRDVVDAGQEPGLSYHTDEDYDGHVDQSPSRASAAHRPPRRPRV
jgi:hypothetical protein